MYSPGAGAHDAQKPRAHYRLPFAVMAASVCAFALLQSLVIPALPTLQAEMRTNQATVTWGLTAYLLSASVFTRSSVGSETRSVRAG